MAALRAHGRATSVVLGLHSSPGILLTVCIAVDLEVAIPQDDLAVPTSEAVDVELHGALVFQILPLDTVSARATQAAVHPMVVAFAVWPVAMHIKFCCLEWFAAACAPKTRFVVPAGQTPICARNRLSSDGVTAALAVATRRLHRRDAAPGHRAPFW